MFYSMIILLSSDEHVLCNIGRWSLSLITPGSLSGGVLSTKEVEFIILTIISLWSNFGPNWNVINILWCYNSYELHVYNICITKL